MTHESSTTTINTTTTMLRSLSFVASSGRCRSRALLSSSTLRQQTFDQHARVQLLGTVTTMDSVQRRGMAHAKSFHVPLPPSNTDEAYFDFTDENYQRVAAILAKYPDNYKKSAMIPLLDLAQRQSGGYLPLAAMEKVAYIVGEPKVSVYEVASFYSMFNRTPVGKYYLQVCGTTPCMICGAQDILKTIKSYLHIEDGETTTDGLFTLLEVECLGSCANAPMLQLNDDYYECLTPETTIQLLKACQAGSPPPMGVWGSLPMNGQVSCEGPLGKTTLTWKEPIVPPVAENRFEKKVDPATVKQHMAY